MSLSEDDLIWALRGMWDVPPAEPYLFVSRPGLLMIRRVRGLRIGPTARSAGRRKHKRFLLDALYGRGGN